MQRLATVKCRYEQKCFQLLGKSSRVRCVHLDRASNSDSVRGAPYKCLYYYPRRARSALGVDTVLTLDVCMFVCMYVRALERKRLIGMT